MNNVRQVFYDAYSYASLFLIVFLTKVQALNNRLLTLCQHRGPQHRLPVWNRALQWTLITMNALCARMIFFLTPMSAILQTKDPTVVSNNLRRLPSDFQDIPKPFVASQLLTDADHFEHQTVNTDQLNEEIRNHPQLHHVAQPPEPQAVLASNTDHFEHQTVNTDQLGEEIRNHPQLHHVSQPPEPQVVLASNTDHFEHQTVNTDQLGEEIRNHPPLHHVVQPPEPQVVLASDTDHFEHVDVETTERLLDEIKSVDKEALNHVSELPARVVPTDIEFLHAGLEAHKN